MIRVQASFFEPAFLNVSKFDKAMNLHNPFDLAVMPRRRFAPLAPLARLRFQAPLVIIVCVVLPALLIGKPRFWDLLALSAISNAFYGALSASIFGLLLFRRLGSFPGITSFGQVLPAVAGPYLVILFSIMILRLEYSRSLLLISAALAVVIFFGLWLYRRRHCVPSIYLLPETEFSAAQAKVFQADLSVPLHAMDRNPIIVADLRKDLDGPWHEYVLDAALSGVPVYHFKQLQESLLGRVEVEHLSENSFGSLSPNLIYTRLKRFLDLGAVMALSPILLTVFLVVALAIKIDSPGRVFYIQRRMGYRGVIFNMIKFRSMREEESQIACREREKTQDKDARITRLGRFLRRYRLDELPQVVNIIRGEMSWIGPRPEAAELARWYHAHIPFYGYRHMVPPGITGWAQVHQGHVHGIDEVTEKLQYDFYYIKYFSWWLDVLIVLRTVRTLLIGNGVR